MTDEQRRAMHRLLYTFAEANQSLGSLPTSYGWNEANAKCERAEKAIWELLNNLGTAK